VTDAALPLTGVYLTTPAHLAGPLQAGFSLPVDPLVAVAFVLLVGGVVGSVVPVVPSGLLSLLGVYTYWFATGYDEPGLLLLSGLTLVALVATAVDWLSGAISAKAGGASTRTTVLATVVGFLGLLAFGPLGFLVGTAGLVFVLTYAENGEARKSLRAAGVTLLGMLTSNLLQVLLTGGILIVMILVVLL
jgi:uncharacterized protein YqgC (DUF456 family)